jgi:integrase
VRRFLDAATQEGELVVAVYVAAVYTGMREGELAGLHWADVDLERRLITVQRSFKGPTKADDVRYVPILDPLLPVLRSWRLRCPGTLVFPNRDGRMHHPSARIFQETLHRVLDLAGFERVNRKGKARPIISFHSLRHTFASHWMMRGGDLFKLQKILGHKSVQMTQRYAHLAPDAFTADFGRLGSRTVAAMADVIPLAPPSAEDPVASTLG